MFCRQAPTCSLFACSMLSYTAKGSTLLCLLCCDLSLIRLTLCFCSVKKPSSACSASRCPVTTAQQAMQASGRCSTLAPCPATSQKMSCRGCSTSQTLHLEVRLLQARHRHQGLLAILRSLPAQQMGEQAFQTYWRLVLTEAGRAQVSMLIISESNLP